MDRSLPGILGWENDMTDVTTRRKPRQYRHARDPQLLLQRSIQSCHIMTAWALLATYIIIIYYWQPQPWVVTAGFHNHHRICWRYDRSMAGCKKRDRLVGITCRKWSWFCSSFVDSAPMKALHLNEARWARLDRISSLRAKVLVSKSGSNTY